MGSQLLGHLGLSGIAILRWMDKKARQGQPHCCDVASRALLLAKGTTAKWKKGIVT
jgi:hypothetical protein